MSLNALNIIKKPLISEKGAALAETSNIYAFEVSTKASKPEIRAAVESLFKVKVSSVRTMVCHGDIRRVGRFSSKRPNWKKALVTLEKGQKIELFQGA